MEGASCTFFEQFAEHFEIGPLEGGSLRPLSEAWLASS